MNAVIMHPDLDLATKNAVARAANKVTHISIDIVHYIDRKSDYLDSKRPVRPTLRQGANNTSGVTSRSTAIPPTVGYWVWGISISVRNLLCKQVFMAPLGDPL